MPEPNQQPPDEVLEVDEGGRVHAAGPDSRYTNQDPVEDERCREEEPVIRQPWPPAGCCTQYTLEPVIRRALAECLKAKFISAELTFTNLTEPGEIHVRSARVVIDERQVAAHISATVIGELYELEMVRKLGPLCRALNQLLGDFHMLDEVAADFSRVQTMRIEIPPG